MIEVKNLRKSFDGVEVLKGINTTFETGKVNLIIGQSGSGKTVFLKSLLNVFEPNEGHILFDGRDIVGMGRAEKEALRSEIGTVFQGSALFDSMTVQDNIMFPLDMFTNLTFTEKKKRVKEVIGRVHLENAEKKFPSEISGGMQKRVAIARAIVNNPKYLFCDEPNSGLDPFTSNIIDDLIAEIKPVVFSALISMNAIIWKLFIFFPFSAAVLFFFCLMKKDFPLWKKTEHIR